MFTCGPAFYGSIGIAPGVLDAYTTNLWSCWSIEKRLITAYGIGPAISVRHQGFLGTTDIRLLGDGSLDVASLLAFANGGSCYVAKVYDQSGNGNDWVNPTDQNQPRIVNSGVYDGKIVFNPAVDVTYLYTQPLVANSSSAKTIFRKVNQRSVTTNGAEFEYGQANLIGTASGANQIRLLNNTSPNNNALWLATDTGAAYSTAFYNGVSEANTVNGIIIDKLATPGGAQFKWYQGGAVQSQSFATTIGSPTYSGNFPNYYWVVGADYGSATLPADIDMWSCAVYDGDMSANANAINAALA